MNVILPFLKWYLVIFVLGVVSFPLTFRWLRALPDKGYAFSRPLGLLIWGYVFWLLSSLGMLQNNLGGLIVAAFILLALSVWALRAAGWETIWDWVKEHAQVLLVQEVLFFLIFLLFMLFRAINPDLLATEKPMELAFINAILKSPQMPPHDPWLSGYAISYYYMGYVFTAMLAQVTAVSGGVAFNLMIALVFAMAALGAYGLVYNLLAHTNKERKWGNLSGALLAPLFVTIVSNVEGFLEFLHQKGLFWSTDEAGLPVSDFWRWMDIKDLVNPPAMRAQYWWWWRASRVVNDYSFQGGQQEVIDEFPFFSLLLADLHPHVLVMPFAFLAMALALAVFLDQREDKPKANLWLASFDLSWEWIGFASLVFGSLMFLNIWDFPLYVGLFAGAYTLRYASKHGWHWQRLVDFILLGMLLGLSGIFMYFPYIVGFSSQAGGVLPNVVNPTRGAHLWTMFGTLFLPIFGYLIFSWWRRKNIRGFAKSLGGGFIITLVFWLLSLGIVWVLLVFLPSMAGFNPAFESVDVQWLSSQGADDWASFFELGWARRISGLGGWLTLTILVGLSLGLLWPKQTEDQSEDQSAERFVWLLILFAGLLVLVPEFIYLRDNFNTRMNTIFKFYFQGWLLWSVAAAFGSVLVLRKAKLLGALLYAPLLIGALVIGSFYPFRAIKEHVGTFLENEATVLKLDGEDHFTYLTPSEHAAVAWLKEAPLGTVVEAIGDSYSGYARIATYSGQPNVLGWPGHQGQWRGGYEEVGTRIQDVERLYITSNWGEAQEILARYDIRYIVVGGLERSTYALNLGKFEQLLTPVFEEGDITIYGVPDLSGVLPESAP